MGVKNWKLAGNNLDPLVDAIQRKFALPRPIALFFAARGIKEEEVQDFLNPRLANLSDPYRFPGIQDAAKRLWDAIANKETILIHGDYDTDGITASALLALVLRQNGADVHSFIPHRFDDGYGFTPESLQKALDTFGPASVLVTVDCGITSCDAVDEAVRRGIDVIVTDHHEAGQQLPNAIAIINPKVYPELEDLQLLAGAGAAFKLSHAFIKYGREHNLGGFQTRLEEVLDYVALGTVADIVPLLGENRIMVKYGIEALRRQIPPGVRALIESSKLRSELTPADITFRMAPRINAAGRVGDANVALQLLESEHIVDAYKCASQLESFNRIRQEKEQEIYQEACEQIERNLAWQSDYSLLVAGRDWHQGVIGIVASRIVEVYYRPVLILCSDGESLKGSGRSVPEFDLHAGLTRCADMLLGFGGHRQAAGLRIAPGRLDELRERFDAVIREELGEAPLTPSLKIDAEMPFSQASDFTVLKGLELLQPFGIGNPEPIFASLPLRVKKRKAFGHSREHISLEVTEEGSGITLQAKAWRQADQIPESIQGQRIRLAYTPGINAYNGIASVELRVRDWEVL